MLTPQWRGAIAALGVALAVGGCTTIRPPDPPSPLPLREFSHQRLGDLLGRFVDGEGLVDYAALATERASLDHYYRLLASVSPDSRPELFPDEASRLAYWLNAYNAAVLRAVLEHYPIDSVADVGPPLVPAKIGFFLLQRLTFGGATTNLWYLEHRIIRARFVEPRIHFALNCGARGCPRLPREAFDPRRLGEQLEREARRFFAEPRNFSIDHAARVVRLSAILDWYEQDFTTFLVRRSPGGEEPRLLDYVALYAPPAARGDLERARDYALDFVAYDWRLNDRRRPGALDGLTSRPSRAS